MTRKNKGFRTCRTLAGVLGLCLLAVSCGSKNLLDETGETPLPAWDYDEPVCFGFFLDAPDTALPCDLIFSLKHTRDFAWSNAFFLITTVFPDMNTTVDTLECLLAEPSGRWYGSRLGKYHSMSVLYKQGIRFPMPGEYRFMIQHAMREDALRDITEVGLKVTPAERRPARF